MTIFERLAPTAKRLIDVLDADVVVVGRSITETPQFGDSTITTTEYAAKAALKDFEETFNPDTRRKVTTGMVIVPASYLTAGAEVGWSVFLDDATTDTTLEYKVIDAERVPKLGEPIVWKLKVRK